jgi:hypothetical protein
VALLLTSFYDRQGEPVDALAWDRLFADLSYRTVAEDEVGAWRVITLWSGVDLLHLARLLNPGHALPPVIFETAIFTPGGAVIAVTGDDTEIGLRYCTEDQALAGHARAVSWVREAGAASAAGSATGGPDAR